MKISTIMRYSVVLITGITVIGIIALAVLWLRPAHLPFRIMRERRIKILYETDHQELLDACRELSRQVKAGEIGPGRYSIWPDMHPTAAQFPQVILDLAPAYVALDYGGRVVVAMLGGLDLAGVVFYPEDSNISSPQNVPFGDVQIIDGLWYYDGGYDRWPDWQEVLDALRPKYSTTTTGGDRD